MTTSQSRGCFGDATLPYVPGGRLQLAPIEGSVLVRNDIISLATWLGVLEDRLLRIRFNAMLFPYKSR